MRMNWDRVNRENRSIRNDSIRNDLSPPTGSRMSFFVSRYEGKKKLSTRRRRERANEERRRAYERDRELAAVIGDEHLKWLFKGDERRQSRDLQGAAECYERAAALGSAQAADRLRRIGREPSGPTMPGG